MWESPVYTFAKKIRDSGELRDLVIDVTGSAPTMDEPGKTLESVFEVLTHGKSPEKTKILDVGAAKLRNTLHFLKLGFTAYAVEFEELRQRMPQAKASWERARKYTNFKRLIFPKEFFAFKEKVDIVLFINVSNVMPIPNERLVLLSLCRQRMKKDALLLWYNWRDISSNPTKYTDKTRINDGYFKGVGRRTKTFHGEWERAHVFDMIISSGFSFDDKIDLPDVGNNQAFVFRADGPLLLDKFLDLRTISRGGKKSDPKKAILETGPIDFPMAYVDELKNVRVGISEATKFHHLSERLISDIFHHQLKNPEIEKEINEGRARIDIRLHNRNKPGFFKNLKDMRDILCPTVAVECKNYQSDPNNPEFDQLSGRLTPLRGKFGLLICRKIINRRRTIGHCTDRVKKEEFIIVLDDGDMAKLASLKKAGDEEVDDYMDKKMDEIID